MKKFLSILLLIGLLLCSVACDDDPYSEDAWEDDLKTSVSKSDQSDESSRSDQSDEDKWGFSAGQSEVEEMTAEQAEEIAQTLVGKYSQLSFLGVCCEGEYSYDDMSLYLNKSQKANYNNAQYKIKCCDSAEEAQKHILKYMHKNIAANIEEDIFFNDDKGNLYIIFSPFGFEGDENTVFSVEEFSNDRIVACKTTTYSNRIEVTRYTIVKKDDDFIIEIIIRRAIIKGEPIVEEMQ